MLSPRKVSITPFLGVCSLTMHRKACSSCNDVDILSQRSRSVVLPLQSTWIVLMHEKTDAPDALMACFDCQAYHKVKPDAKRIDCTRDHQFTTFRF